jgi:hypothetical protein
MIMNVFSDDYYKVLSSKNKNIYVIDNNMHYPLWSDLYINPDLGSNEEDGSYYGNYSGNGYSLFESGMYIDPSKGSNSNLCYNETSPCITLDGAVSKVRPGYPKNIVINVHFVGSAYTLKILRIFKWRYIFGVELC